MYRTVGNLIEILTQKHNLRLEIFNGPEDVEDKKDDNYFYVTVYNRTTGNDEGWSYSLTLFGALDDVVNMKERGE